MQEVLSSPPLHCRYGDVNSDPQEPLWLPPLEGARSTKNTKIKTMMVI